MSDLRFYKVNKPQLILEDFGDETVIVHVESGFYYSVSGSGSRILELIEAGYSDADLATILRDEHGQHAGADAEIRAFVSQLVLEGIITERPRDDGASSPVHAPATASPDKSAWLPPVLERFDEVRDLLLIDPVHQVDENYGWPRQK
jgi:hypothetical protein